MDKRGGGESRFSSRNFLSHNSEKLRFPVAKKIMSNRGDGGFIKILRQKLFVSLPTSSVGKSFTVAIISRIEKVWLRGGGVSSFYVENFLSHSAENFRGGIPHCCNNFGYRKSLDKRGKYQGFLSKFFCPTVQKVFGVEPFSVSLFSGNEKVWIRRRGSMKIFRRNFFVSQCQKIL